MGLSISVPLVLLTAGFVLATWTSRAGGKHPLVTLAGLGCLLAGLLSALVAGTGFLLVARSLLVDTGLALLLAGLVLALRRRGGRPFLLLGAMILGLGVLVAAGVRQLGDAGASDRPGPGALLVELGPDDHLDEILPLLAAHGVRAERAFPSVTLEADENLAQYFLLYGPPDALQRVAGPLSQDAENVDFVEWNRAVRLDPRPAGPPGLGADRDAVADDPLATQQWALDAIHAHAAHRMLQAAAPVRRAVVAILDTGVDAAHEDLQGVLGAAPAHTDRHGHGTHCAGIAGAATNNGRGIASLNWEGRFVEIASYQALPLDGSGTFETIAQAIIDAAQDGADVISMSLGDVAPTPPRVVAEAVAFAQRRGVIVVASAGNADEDAADHMPSNIDGVIAVAAVDRQLGKARFSNTVGRLARPIAAPGVDVLSLRPDGVYEALSGTSMAAPMVAGLIGVLRSLDPALTAADAYALLHRTGTTVDATPHVGRVIDAEAALRALLPESL